MDVSNKELTRRGFLASIGALVGFGASSVASADEHVEVAPIQIDGPGSADQSPDAQVAAPPQLPEQANEHAVVNARGFERIGRVAKTNRGKEISTYKVPGSSAHFEFERPDAVTNLVESRKPDKEGGEVIFVDSFEDMEWEGIQFKTGPAIKLSTALGSPLTFWKIAYVEDNGNQQLYVSPATYGNTLDVYKSATETEKDFVQKELSTYIGEYLALDGDVNRAGSRIPEAFAMGHGSPSLPPAVRVVLT